VTKDEVIRIAKEVNLVFRFDYFEIASENSDGIMINDLTKFANLVAAAEREACVKDVSNALYGQVGCGKAIEAIRARGNNDV
jgi:hypothetical protein